MKKIFHHTKISKGAAALLVTTAMALLFIVLVIALSWLSIREQRQAGDTDLASRAAADAEAGIMDAFAKLNNSEGYREDCVAGEKWICRTIDAKPGPLRIYASQDQPKKALIYAANYLGSRPTSSSDPNWTVYPEKAVHWADQFEIYWCKVTSKENCTENADFTDYLGGLSESLTSDQKALKFPMLELNFTYWQVPDGEAYAPLAGDGRVNEPIVANAGLFWSTYRLKKCNGCTLDASGSLVQNKTILLYAGDAAQVANKSDISPHPDHHLTDGEFKVSCGQTIAISTGYWCKSNKISIAKSIYSTSSNAVPDSDAYKYRMIFAVTPRFRGTHIDARFYNTKIPETSGFANKNTIVPVPAASIEIDVTSKVGNIYRRLVAYKAKTTEARANVTSGVYSGVDICKNMQALSGNNVSLRNGQAGDCNNSYSQ